MLCLANSERIKLTPYVHMVFEVQDLAQASPATVSRCLICLFQTRIFGFGTSNFRLEATVFKKKSTIVQYVLYEVDIFLVWKNKGKNVLKNRKLASPSKF